MAASLKREVALLVALVLATDAVFVAVYLLAGLERGSAGVKLGYTVVWTTATLVAVLWGLARVRRARLEGMRARRGGP